ncbi:MAG TPA: ATPase [Rikenellaceae bacterium]|nr:ATPase [Rikenellaceae bacterium]
MGRANLAVSAQGLVKSYGKVKALNGISLDVSHGETFGIIGPDGAGKSTLFRLLTSLLVPDKGSAQVEGLDTVKDYRQIRRIIGYMPGKFSLYQDLTVEENLTFFATLFGTTIQENYHLVEDIYRQIEPFKDRMAGKLSGGMKQKLALCCALIHKPKVLFLDEPTTGVDPVSRKEFWDMLGRLKNDGITILVSTPYMDEAGRCDRIALIRNGQFLTVNSPAGIIAEFPDRLYSVRSDRMHALLGDLRAYTGTVRAFSFGDSVHLSTGDGFDCGELKSYLEMKGHGNVTINTIRPTVEDCFMRI